MTNLQAIEGICNLNTSEVTNMFGMFGVCKKMKILDLSSFNTAKVNNMGGMFWKCSELQTIYVGDGWSTAAVTGSCTVRCRITVLSQPVTTDLRLS